MKKETLSTSEKEIPKHRNALSEKYEEAKKIGQEAEPLNPEIFKSKNPSCQNLVAGDF